MSSLGTKFAEAGSSQSGLGAFNINLKSFIFQLITFVLVVLILKRWVFPKLISTLDQRQQTLEKSLVQAKQTEETLAKAEAKSEEMLSKARAQADQSLAEAKKSAAEAIAKGEASAGQRAELIVKEAETRLGDEREKLRQELRGELADLVADATEKIIDQKLDEKQDRSLIEHALKGLSR